MPIYVQYRDVHDVSLNWERPNACKPFVTKKNACKPMCHLELLHIMSNNENEIPRNVNPL